VTLMTRTRATVGIAGAALIAYGAWRILGTARLTRPPTLALWLVGAVVVHDGILAPLTMTTGYVIGKVFRPRSRRYVVGALVTAAMITAIAVPLIHRRGRGPTGSALEVRDYASNLVLLLGGVALVTTAAYLVRVMRDGRRHRRSATNVLPPADQTSSTT
jgi:hypothetical protein